MVYFQNFLTFHFYLIWDEMLDTKVVPYKIWGQIKTHSIIFTMKVIPEKILRNEPVLWWADKSFSPHIHEENLCSEFFLQGNKPNPSGLIWTKLEQMEKRIRKPCSQIFSWRNWFGRRWGGFQNLKTALCIKKKNVTNDAKILYVDYKFIFNQF